MTITIQMIPCSMYRYPQMTWMAEKFFSDLTRIKLKSSFLVQHHNEKIIQFSVSDL